MNPKLLGVESRRAADETGPVTAGLNRVAPGRWHPVRIGGSMNPGASPMTTPQDHRPQSGARGAVQDACMRMLEEDSDVLLFAALTDRSFEEGVRARDFRESVESFRVVGVAESDLQRMAAGLNGLLETHLRRDASIEYVARNQSRVPDHCVRARACAESLTFLEVKQIYDLTMTKYFPMVAEDREKLLLARAQDGRLELLQVVFFLQLPHFAYPAGRWYGHKACPARSSYEVRVGIPQQVRAVEALLGPPSWPDSRPLVRPWSAAETAKAAPILARWMRSVFVAHTDWTFDPEIHLREAAIGVGMWAW